MKHGRGTRNQGLPLFFAMSAGLAAAIGASTPATSQSTDGNPVLQWPADCTLGETCWIARYMDRASGKKQVDHQCGLRSQNQHKGTDIALSDMEVMDRGVAVLAALPGTVFRLRNNMPDQPLLSTEDRARIKGKECGNAIILVHEGGWQTQYCHLKQDSLLVKQGDSVRAGDPIAEIGLSGETEFPHLHFMVRAPQSQDRSTRDIDPFDSGAFEDDRCSAQPTNNPALWANGIAYQPSAVMPPVIDTARRNRETMWNPQASTLPAGSPALIVQARGFHALEGDEWHIRLMDPSGRLRVNQTIQQAKNRQRVQAFAGLRMPTNGFLQGRWSASVELMRDGISISRQTTTTLID